MRKILVFALALMVVFGMSGLVLANNESTVEQTGGFQTATVNQTGDNKVEIYQLTDNDGSQIATSNQNGIGNVIYIDQSQVGGGGNGTNTAYANQVGDNNNIWQEKH